MLNVIAGYDPPDPTSVRDRRRRLSRRRSPRGIRGLRIGVPRAVFFTQLDDEVAAAVERALDELRAARRRGARRRHRRASSPASARPSASCSPRRSRSTPTRSRTRPDDFGADVRAILANPTPRPARR